MMEARIPHQSRAGVGDDSLFYQSFAAKAMERQVDLPLSVWSKVIALGNGRVLAKVYATELSLLVTGSLAEFDDLELGLGAFVDMNTNPRTHSAIHNLQEGVELKRDFDGSVLAKRLCHQPITVKHLPDGYLSEELIRCRGFLPLGRFIKVFDMKEFRCLINVMMRCNDYSKAYLTRRCVVGLNISEPGPTITETPCCLVVVCLGGLRLLEDTRELGAMALVVSQIGLADDEKREEMRDQREVKSRRQRPTWARTDQRDQLKLRDQNARKAREELRRKGELISDHMSYSWEEAVEARKVINMDRLYERTREQPLQAWICQPKQWAKVVVALRELSREDIKVETRDLEHVLD